VSTWPRCFAIPTRPCGGSLLDIVDGKQDGHSKLTGIEWPKNPEEELMTCIYLTLAHLVVEKQEISDAAKRADWEKVIEKTKDVQELMHTKGEFLGTWDPVGLFGSEVGRIGVCGAGSLLLLARWRKCYLAMWQRAA
jgi:hypothetical protein